LKCFGEGRGGGFGKNTGGDRKSDVKKREKRLTIWGEKEVVWQPGERAEKKKNVHWNNKT